MSHLATIRMVASTQWPPSSLAATTPTIACRCESVCGRACDSMQMFVSACLRDSCCLCLYACLCVCVSVCLCVCVCETVSKYCTQVGFSLQNHVRLYCLLCQHVAPYVLCLAHLWCWCGLAALLCSSLPVKLCQNVAPNVSQGHMHIFAVCSDCVTILHLMLLVAQVFLDIESRATSECKLRHLLASCAH